MSIDEHQSPHGDGQERNTPNSRLSENPTGRLDVAAGARSQSRQQEGDVLTAGLGAGSTPADALPLSKSCHCPAAPGEDCPLTLEECAARTTAPAAAEEPRPDRRQFRKKPVVIEGWRVSELNRCAAHDWKALPKPVADDYERGGWVFGVRFDGDAGRGISVPTLEGPLMASPDDWIIRGINGEFYPCKPDIFAVTYEPVDASLPPAAAEEPRPDPQPEICICAAWRTDEGPVIRGHRHPHCRDAAIAMHLTPTREQEAQGFITSTGRFVGRAEGMALQRAAGQKSHYSPDGELRGDMLFSEDLYMEAGASVPLPASSQPQPDDSRMNFAAFKNLIAEDLAWLQKQPRSTERSHIGSIVENCHRYYYPDHESRSPHGDGPQIAPEPREAASHAPIPSLADVAHVGGKLSGSTPDDSLTLPASSPQPMSDAYVEALVADIVSCADEADGGKPEAEMHCRELIRSVASTVEVQHRAEVQQLQNRIAIILRGGIIDYQEHWELRAYRAEAEVQRLTAQIEQAASSPAPQMAAVEGLIALTHELKAAVDRTGDHTEWFTPLARLFRAVEELEAALRRPVAPPQKDEDDQARVEPGATIRSAGSTASGNGVE